MFLPMSCTSPFFDVGQQVRDRLLHHARRLHHLRQEHLAGAEQVADGVHAGHQRALDHLERAPAACSDRLPDLLGVLDDEVGDAVDERVRQALLDRQRAPRQARRVVLAGALGAVGDLDQALAGVLAAIEHHVLDALLQLRVEVVVDANHAGVDDAHVHAGADGVVEEDGVDRFAHRLVAAEGEADVGDAAADLGAGQVSLDPARGLDEVDRVVVVFLDAGGYREDVGVEDDVLGREADVAREDAVGARADLRLALEAVGLALFVEGHHDRGGAVAAHERGLAPELGLALLERDRVDNALALDALQAGLDDAPLRAVDHHRHACDLGLAGHQVQETHHRRLAVEHRLVHVDVDDLGAVLDLLARDCESGLELAGQDHAREGLRSGDVGAFADVHEQRAAVDRDRFEAGQAKRRGIGGRRRRHCSTGIDERGC
jgi:hypothetical protein